MKKFILIIAGMITVMQLFFNCDAQDAQAKSMEMIYKENGVPVQTETVAVKPVEKEYSFHSVLSGIKETVASSMVADKVETIHHKVGDRVTKDAVVITFPTDNPSAQYFQAKVSFEHAQSTLQRMKNLYEKGGISLQEYDNTRTQFEVAKANWDAVKQIVKVKAPISGIVSAINVQESDNVKPSDKLFTISQTHKLKTKLWVSEKQIKNIKNGNKAIATWNGIELAGTVSQADLAMNTQKQAFGVTIEFDNPEQKIVSGINAKILVYGNLNKTAIITPRANIVKEEGQAYVFVAENGKAVKKPVSLGDEFDVNIEITNGLNSGEKIITKGLLLLKNQSKINILNAKIN